MALDDGDPLQLFVVPPSTEVFTGASTQREHRLGDNGSRYEDTRRRGSSRRHHQRKSRSHRRSRSGSARRRSRSFSARNANLNRRSRSCSRRQKRSPAHRRGEEITTLFVTGLPEDVHDEDVRSAFGQESPVVRCSTLKRGPEMVAFVRFETLWDMRRAMQGVKDGKIEVCGVRVRAEVARQNTVTNGGTRDSSRN